MKGILPNEFPFTRNASPPGIKQRPRRGRNARAHRSCAHAGGDRDPGPWPTLHLRPGSPWRPLQPRRLWRRPEPAAPVENTDTGVIPVNRHATSRASITPVATGAALPADARDTGQKPRSRDGGTRLRLQRPRRRRSPRQSLRTKAVYRNDLNPAAAGPVQILNFSMCGFRLWSTRSMKVGQRTTVKMGIGPVKWTGTSRSSPATRRTTKATHGVRVCDQ